MKIILSLYKELFISPSWKQAGQFFGRYVKDLIFQNGAYQWKQGTQKIEDNCNKNSDLKFFRWNGQLFPISSEAFTV